MILRNTRERILCVCYTNHALDKFLEHLLEAGQNKMVRIGGRSKSPTLEPFQLHKGSIGFLKEPQRVNVLLSRARNGLFLVGNAECLRYSKAGSIVWDPIIRMLEEKRQVKRGLPTRCQLHPDDDPIELCKPADFRLYRPNGGYNRPCSFRMNCGHSCREMCHPTDPDHRQAQNRCHEPCPRFPKDCQRGHISPKMCCEPCGDCHQQVGPTGLLCGHISLTARCFEVGSPGAMFLFTKKCREPTLFTFSSCNHEVMTTCSNASHDVRLSAGNF